MAKHGSNRSAELHAEQHSLLPPTLLRLEDRIVLDAAGGGEADHHDPLPDLPLPHHHDDPAHHHDSDPADDAAHGEHAAHDAGTDAISAALQAAFNNEPTRVLIIGADIDDGDTLAAAARENVLVVQLDANDTLADVLAELRTTLGGRQADSIAIATHGQLGGGLTLTDVHTLTLDTLHSGELRAFWAGVESLLKTGGRVDLLACDAAAGTEGAQLIQTLERVTGLDFAASDDATGNASAGGDWLLETDHVRVDTLYFRPDTLQSFDQTLAAPTITDSDPGTTAVGGHSPVVVDASITVDDGGAGTIEGAVVHISPDTYNPDEDTLAFTPAYGITGSFNTETGELLLSGAAADWQYQEVLRSVTYENSSGHPDTTPREITFTIGTDFDGYSYNATTGHYYLLQNSFETWNNAQMLAHDEANALYGLRGYLATVTSAAEQTYIDGLLGTLPGFTLVWFGAGDDVTTEGEWYWLTGPEATGDDAHFWQGGASGSPVDGAYTNWFGGSPSNNPSLNRITFLTSSNQWLAIGAGGSFRYLVEFGGDTDDAEGQINASVLVNVAEPNYAPVLDNAGLMTLTNIAEDDLASAGTSIAAIIDSAGGDRITDANGDPEGIALIGVDTSHGTWQYSTDGGAHWYTVGSVTAGHALLLRDSDLLRFQPATDYNGTLVEALRFRAWDQTAGTVGTYADASTAGGESAFSSATETAALTINSVNDAPTLADALADQTANEDTPFTYTFDADTFTDGDTGDTLTYSATLADGSPLPDWLVFDPNTRTLHGTPAQADVGTLAIRVTATDSHGAAASDVFDLAVHEVNDAPHVADPLTDHVADEGEPFSYQFDEDAFIDDDPGDTLSYSAALADGSALPSWLTFDPATHTFTGTPAAADGGTLQIRVTAIDGRGGSASDVFLLTVNVVTPETPTPTPPPTDQPADTTPEPMHTGSNSGGASQPASDADPGQSPAPDDGANTPADAEAPALDDGSSADAGDAADTGAADADLGSAPAADAATASGDASSADAGGHAGAAAAHSAGATGANGPGGGHNSEEDEFGSPGDHDDEYLTDFNSQLTTTLLTGDFLDDQSQPIEFRAAWSAILSAYSDSSAELAAYLQSAFRAVTESALINQAADEALNDLLAEQMLVAEAGVTIDLDELIAGLRSARTAVRQASNELETAIQAAADAGRTDRFDRVLEDVIGAALEQLMAANERLYVESQATLAAVALLREGRSAAPQVIGPETLASATTIARSAAHDEIVALRSSWDRVAQDVFAAFVARLASERGDADAPPATPPQP